MIRESVPNDCKIKLHQANVAEIAQYTSIPYTDAIEALYKISIKRWTITDKKGKILSIAGVVKNGDSIDIWLLFSDVNRLPISFFKETKAKVREIVKVYGAVKGKIYILNTFALQWAKFIGAEIEKLPRPAGLYEGLFYNFIIKE